jgi:hypothetical protein
LGWCGNAKRRSTNDVGRDWTINEWNWRTHYLSLCAGVTVTLVSLHQKRKQWVDDFRALYAEFWNDKDISQVRRWIVSNKLYDEVLKPVLAQRIEKGYNDLDKDGSMKIDMIDKFMSLIFQ